MLNPMVETRGLLKSQGHAAVLHVHAHTATEGPGVVGRFVFPLKLHSFGGVLGIFSFFTFEQQIQLNHEQVETKLLN